MLLLGLVGGLSSVINWLQATLHLTPWFRSYNRVSIFLGFVVLLG